MAVERGWSVPDPAPTPDLCTERALRDLLHLVGDREWATRPDVSFGAFVAPAVCRVVVQSDSLTEDEERALLELDPNGRVLVERTEGPVELP